MSTTEVPDSINGSSSKEIIYGVGRGLSIEQSLIFVPKDFAEHQATLIDGLRSSDSWGELKAKMPPDIYEEVLSHFGYSIEDGEEPKPDENFNVEDDPGVQDGDWPTWLLAYQLEWMPSDILSEFGELGNSMASGAAVDFNPADERKIVRAFRKLGYTCIKDAGLLEDATYPR